MTTAQIVRLVSRRDVKSAVFPAAMIFASPDMTLTPHDAIVARRGRRAFLRLCFPRAHFLWS
jgi:hypothetical protein